MTPTQQRERLRAVLAGAACVSPASVYDPLSARVAESVGYTFGMLAGSVASNTTLAAPDLIVLTLTEMADQIRRIMRASDLSLLIDADHGYGNALSVMRTVQELEHAGASAISIEDTVLPTPFGRVGQPDELISTGEMVGKLRAAVAAKRDPSFIIFGRTSALRAEGTESAVQRVKAYASTGVDGMFVVGLETLEQAQAIHDACGMPLVVGTAPASITASDLVACGARILLLGHQPVAAAVKALRETYAHLYNGGTPAALRDRIASTQEMDQLTAGPSFKQWQAEYLT